VVEAAEAFREPAQVVKGKMAAVDRFGLVLEILNLAAQHEVAALVVAGEAVASVDACSDSSVARHKAERVLRVEVSAQSVMNSVTP
jgi:hypothetical protein